MHAACWRRWALLPVLTLELVVFSVLAYALLRRWPALWWVALPALLAAKLASLLFLLVNPVIPAPALTFTQNALINGLPGLLLLLALGYAAMRYRDASRA